MVNITNKRKFPTIEAVQKYLEKNDNFMVLPIGETIFKLKSNGVFETEVGKTFGGKMTENDIYPEHSPCRFGNPDLTIKSNGFILYGVEVKRIIKTSGGYIFENLSPRQAYTLNKLKFPTIVTFLYNHKGYNNSEFRKDLHKKFKKLKKQNKLKGFSNIL